MGKDSAIATFFLTDCRDGMMKIIDKSATEKLQCKPSGLKLDGLSSDINLGLSPLLLKDPHESCRAFLLRCWNFSTRLRNLQDKSKF